MTQSELDSAVSTLTGEDVSEIRRRGFSLIDPFDPDFDPEPDDMLPPMVDWDQLQHDRQSPPAGKNGKPQRSTTYQIERMTSVSLAKGLIQKTTDHLQSGPGDNSSQLQTRN